MEEFKFLLLHSNDDDIICLYLNILQEKYGMDSLISSLRKEKVLSFTIYKINPDNSIASSFRTNAHRCYAIPIMYKDNKFITYLDYDNLLNRDYI